MIMRLRLVLPLDSCWAEVAYLGLGVCLCASECALLVARLQQ